MQNEITEEMVQAAMLKLGPLFNHHTNDSRDFPSAVRIALSAALAAADEQVPVAKMWWCKCADEDRDMYFGDEGDFVTESQGDAEEAEENGFTVTPLYASPPVASPETEGWVMVPVDMVTHLHDWEAACRIALEHAEVSAPDLDDKSYWQRQLDTLANVRAMLSARPIPPCDGRAEALEARRLALEEALTAVKACSSPDILGKYVAIGPGGVIAIACNAIRALIPQKDKADE